MSDLSVTHYLHNLPLPRERFAHGWGRHLSTRIIFSMLRRYMRLYSSLQQQMIRLFWTFNPLLEYLPMPTHKPATSSVLWMSVYPA